MEIVTILSNAASPGGHKIKQAITKFLSLTAFYFDRKTKRCTSEKNRRVVQAIQGKQDHKL